MTNLPPDVPSPIDLQSEEDAIAWAQRAMEVRPWRTEFFACFAAEIAQMRLQRPTPEPMRVLELGSGPGFLAQHLLAALPDVSMVLLDFSKPMHALAQARLAPFLDRVAFVERSFKATDWPDGLGHFDAVVTNQAVHELRHKRHAAMLHAQVRALLTPAGRYLFSDHFAGDEGMKNTELYMTPEEHQQALQTAGYSAVHERLRKGGMVFYSAT